MITLLVLLFGPYTVLCLFGQDFNIKKEIYI